MFKQAVGAIHSAAIFSRRARAIADGIRPLLPKNAKVLDVGTGDGTIASLWLDSRPDLTIGGIDVHPRPATKIPVTLFDGRTLPFPDDSHDVVTFVDVLHHTNDVPHLLQEAARVARRYVIIKDHLAENALDFQTLRLMDWVGNAPHGVRLPYNYLSEAQWSAAYAESNLERESIVTDVPLYPVPLSWIFGRKLHFIARLRTSAQ
jgi:ubiquinone/menaquinone biosynthesis C-methylase UbiE